MSVPLDDAQLRREEVIGKPLTDLLRGPLTRQSNSNCAPPLHEQAREKLCALRSRSIRRTDLVLDLSMTITSHMDANQQIEYLICAGQRYH